MFDDGKNARLAYTEAVGRIPLDLKAELHQAGKFLKSQVPAATGHANMRSRLCGEFGFRERRRWGTLGFSIEYSLSTQTCIAWSRR